MFANPLLARPDGPFVELPATEQAEEILKWYELQEVDVFCEALVDDIEYHKLVCLAGLRGDYTRLGEYLVERLVKYAEHRLSEDWEPDWPDSDTIYEAMEIES